MSLVSQISNLALAIRDKFNEQTGRIVALEQSGAILKGTGTVTVPNWSYDFTGTISAVGVAPSDVIFVGLGAFTDEDENDPSLLNIAAMSAVAGTDEITVNLAFLTPTSGLIRLNWSAQ